MRKRPGNLLQNGSNYEETDFSPSGGVMLLTACGQDIENDQGAVYVNITAEEAEQIMDSEEGCIILDVRTQNVFLTRL